MTVWSLSLSVPPTMMNGHIRMLSEIVKVGRKCILQLEPFLSHFCFVSREDYEIHMARSFTAGMLARPHQDAEARSDRREFWRRPFRFS